MKVTVWAWNQAKGFNNVAVKALQALGYNVTLKPVRGDKYWGTVADSRNRAQIGFWGSAAVGYPSPAAFLVALFSCAAFVPRSTTTNNNPSEFCDPSIDRQMQKGRRKNRAIPPEPARSGNGSTARSPTPLCGCRSLRRGT
jgi:ABC-type transport system substrate-binding protein